ncbi:DUF1573 domain-containing protein [uncultured Flavobacterium sp.]|jgi:uncharacterized membrane protein|uniref:DUF1573 domain-containing protein n=1 Tax=uncultured Flavobacterium sp. TaxID=165435 RepID=UPI0030CA2453
MKVKLIPLFAIVILFAVSSCKENASSKITEADMKVANEFSAVSEKLPVLEFDKTEHDFGSINEGDKVSTEFIVTNTGDADLIIVSAVGSCGCTVPVWKKEAIKPGESTPILVTFDSNGKPGQQEKSVTITANTANGKEVCKIKANVKPKTNKATTAITN